MRRLALERDQKEMLNFHAMVSVDVAHLAGVPDSIVTRAESISKEFFADLQEKLARRRRSKLSSIAQAGAFTMLTSRRFHRLERFLFVEYRLCLPRQRMRSQEQGASGG
jgi:hypothetical protein